MKGGKKGKRKHRLTILFVELFPQALFSFSYKHSFVSRRTNLAEFAVVFLIKTLSHRRVATLKFLPFLSSEDSLFMNAVFIEEKSSANELF